jgi:limonene-1,2-epoxide hydrolase
MFTPAETVENFIAAFIAAWPLGDPTTLGSFLSEGAVYHNIPMEPVAGREAILATFAEFMSMGGAVSVDIIHMVADGAIVMTERVDHFIGSESTISLPLMGIIEVHDGAIIAWRDYFDATHLMPG